MDTSTNSLNWFEIPARDIQRAKTFYETIFGHRMEYQEMGELKMAMFPFENGSGKASGALVEHEMYVPNDNGVVIYLNGNPNLKPILDRVEAAGGKVLMAKKQIAEDVGYMALFLDSEGNRMALHSQE